MKKTLVFYKGRAPKGEKTNWVMYEFRLEGKFACYHLPIAAKDEWAVCKVFHKNTDTKKTTVPELLRLNSFADGLLDCSSLPPLADPTHADKDNPCGNEFKGNTIPALSSTKSVDLSGYYLSNFGTMSHPILVKQENHSNFQMAVNSYNTLGACSQANLSNPPLGSSFPYQAMTEYRSGYLQGGKSNYYPANSVLKFKSSISNQRVKLTKDIYVCLGSKYG